MEVAKVTPQLACGTMVGILISESERCLDSVVAFLRFGAKSPANQDLVSFLTQADSFAGACGLRIAAELRTMSTQAEVRETAEPVLARLVRNRCFDRLDTALGAYLNALKQLNVELKPALAQMADSKLKELASATEAVAASGNGEAQRKASLAEVSRGPALLAIWNYLRQFDSIAREVVDYSSLKTFGPDADYQLQKAYVQNVGDAIHEKLTTALSVIEEFDAVRERKWAQIRAEEDATIKGVALAATRQANRGKSSCRFVGHWCGIARAPPRDRHEWDWVVRTATRRDRARGGWNFLSLSGHVEFLGRLMSKATNPAQAAWMAAVSLTFFGCAPASAPNSSAETKTEIARLTEENRALTDLRRTNEEVIRLRKENEALPALRNQYRQLQELQKENDALREQLSRTNQSGGGAPK